MLVGTFHLNFENQFKSSFMQFQINNPILLITIAAYTDDHNSHGQSYTYNIPESNNYGSYDGKLESYGPPKIVHESYVAPQHTYFQEPQSAYGAPEYNGKKRTIAEQMD
jgi:hypothetical protein